MLTNIHALCIIVDVDKAGQKKTAKSYLSRSKRKEKYVHMQKL